ncbi:MAG: dihydroneopterin aldolase [Aeromicrobium erythreum]
MSCPEGLARIDITGLSGTGYHGVFDHERRDGQRFVVDVSLGVDVAEAARTDDLAHTVDYGAISEGVHAFITGEPFALVETLAVRVLDWCLEGPQVRWASVTVHKPEAPITVAFDDVSVTTERSKQ